MLRITAVVPATDQPRDLDRVRAAIDAAEDPPEETIVVELPARSGPARARNSAARRATGEVLVFVDADVLVHPDAFTRIRSRFEADPGLTAVFGSYDDEPECQGVVSRFRNLLHHHVHQSSGGQAMTFWAGLGAIRTEAFLAAGGFDEGRFGPPSIEDVDLGVRLEASGARIELDPGLLGKHAKSWGLRTMVRTDLTRRGAPWVELLIRRRRFPARLNLGWRHLLSALAALALFPALVIEPLVALAVVGSLYALNASLYTLLARKMGVVGAAVALPLHLVYLFTALAAIPVGLAVHARRRERGQESGQQTLEPLEAISR